MAKLSLAAHAARVGDGVHGAEDESQQHRRTTHDDGSKIVSACLRTSVIPVQR
jgi:hypothetical protein